MVAISESEYFCSFGHAGVNVKQNLYPKSYSQMEAVVNIANQTMTFCNDTFRDSCPVDCPVKVVKEAALENLESIKGPFNY